MRLFGRGSVEAQVLVVVSLVLLAACNGGVPSGQAQSAPHATSATPGGTGFDARLQAGADCPELFELRNQLDPKSPRVTNKALRDIGCFSSTSTRRSEESQNASGGFTVVEYRIYRELIDAPMTVSDDQAKRTLAQKYDRTPDQIEDVVDQVSMELFRNDWFGSPASEIRHASDWNGERE